MSDDEADFTVKLIDKVTGNSQSVTRSLDRLFAHSDRINRASMAAAGATKQFSGAIKQAGGSANQASHSFSGAAAAAGHMGGTLEVLGGTLVAHAIERMAELGLEVAKTTGEFVMFAQNSRLAFDQLTKHGVPGEHLFDHARALAVRFGLDLEDTTHAYEQFLALQFNPKQIDDLVRMGADLRGLGNSAEQVNGVFLALGQIKSKGRLMAEEMMQLEERKISGQLVWEEVGKLMGGKSITEVRQLQQQGKVSADIGLEAIQRAIVRKVQEQNLGDLGAKRADTTLRGMFDRMKALGEDAGVTLVDKLTAPLTRMAGKGLAAFENFLGSDNGKAVIDNIAAGLGQAAEFAGKFFGWFREGFGDTWDKLSEGARIMSGASGDGLDLVQVLKSLARTLGQGAALAVGFGVAFVRVAADVAVLGLGLSNFVTGAIDALVRSLAETTQAVLGWWDTLSAIWNDASLGFFGKAWELGKQIVGGLVDGILAVPNRVIDAISSVIGGGIDAAKAALGIHSPSRVFAGFGEQTTAGYVVGISTGEAAVRAAGASMADAHMGGFLAASTAWPGAEFGSPAMSTGALGPEMSATSMAGAAVSPRGGNGPVDINIDITIQGSEHSSAEEIGGATADALERRLDAYFRQLQMETG